MEETFAKVLMYLGGCTFVLIVAAMFAGLMHLIESFAGKHGEEEKTMEHPEYISFEMYDKKGYKLISKELRQLRNGGR